MPRFFVAKVGILVHFIFLSYRSCDPQSFPFVPCRSCCFRSCHLVEVVILVHFIFLSCRSFCSHSHFSFPFILPTSHELLLLFILPTSHAAILVHFISLSCRGCSFHSFDIVPVWKLLLSFTLTCSHAEVVALVHFTFSPCRSCYFHPFHFPFMQKLLLLVILRFSHAEVVLLSQFKFLSGRRFLVRFIVL